MGLLGPFQENTIVVGDCLDVMAKMSDESITAVLTDPPYGLAFMGKGWDSFKNNAQYQEWVTEWATELLRVCKPGAVGLFFGGSRTFHRLACGLEDAGWEIFDTAMWLYGTGFPKSHNVGKALKKHGDEEAGEAFDGYGSALKPAYEPIILARKPRGKTYRECALEDGAAALNIDGCRVGVETVGARPSNKDGITRRNLDFAMKEFDGNPTQGRWPANLILSHHPDCVRVGEKRVKGSNFGGAETGRVNAIFGQDHRPRPAVGYAAPNGLETIEAWECVEGCPVRQLDEQSGVSVSKSGGVGGQDPGMWAGKSQVARGGHDDKGGASRYFKTLKVDNSVFLRYNIEKQEANQCERENEAKLTHGSILTKETGDDIGAGANQEAGSNIANLKADGCGNRSMAQSPRGMKSTTETVTTPTTPLTTCNSSPQAGMTTTTSDCEKTTGTSGELNTGDASDAEDTSPLASSRSERQGLTRDTVRTASETILENGEPKTENIITPICESTESETAKSRFFYTAKASRREREAGLEEMGESFAPKGNYKGRDMANPKNHLGGLQGSKMRNPHPTVKPIALTEYLARLIRPPGEYLDDAVILNPFSGTGSEIIGAIKAGWHNWLGIEMKEQYVDIANARIGYWQ